MRSSIARSLRSALSSKCNSDHHLFRRRGFSAQASPNRKVTVLGAAGGIGQPLALLMDCKSPFAMSIGSKRLFTAEVSHMPEIKDSVILDAFKDLMSVSWDEIPNNALHDVKLALSKSTDDTSRKEVLANVFRVAKAVEEFTGVLTSLKMEFDDSVGMSGEDVKPLPNDLSQALSTVYQRYTAYLDAFGPEESCLRKKVEVELGTKMIHLKMRCGGLESEWGKVTVLGTSGLSGSYIEQRT